MVKCTVIGSGPSGVHFALTALERGQTVEMIDVGHVAPATVNPGDSFMGLKTNLKDPAQYFLGNKNEGVLLPGQQEEFYGIPASQKYALESVRQLRIKTKKFEPKFSFAQGGLAQVWTGGCYPFNELELADFPFAFHDILPSYVEVAKRIGINGAKDDLSEIVPFHDSIQSPLQLDQHSALLLKRYNHNKKLFHDKFGCSFGRARSAVLSEDLGERKACQQFGRCLWGCPVDALYTPSITLKECMKHPRFTYHGNLYVTHFIYNETGEIQSVEAESTTGRDKKTFEVDRLVLACGALSTSKIFLESIYKKTGEVIKLQGLMDNRQILVPFLNPGLIGHPYQPDSYQYNQLAMELANGTARENVHCLITTLKSAAIHPVVEKLPFDLQTSTRIFKYVHAALGLLNVNFHDTRRDDCYITLDIDSDMAYSALRMNYTPPADEKKRINRTLKRIKKILWKLGCVVPPWMVYSRPMGSSVHYAGTLPMSETKKTLTVTPDCQSNDFSNLFIADGATFPFLPAKNITFSLMANAERIARRMD